MRLQFLEGKSVILEPCQHLELKDTNRCNMQGQDGKQTDTEGKRIG
jgi:hypothetical protein